MRTGILLLLCLSAAAAADVTGTWNVIATTPSGREHQMQMILKQEGGKLSGSMSNEQGDMALEELKLTGDELSFRLPVGGGIVVKVTMAGPAISGGFTTPDGGAGKFTASRAAAAKAVPVAGHWDCDVTPAGGRPYKVQLDLVEEDGKLRGTVTRGDGDVPVDDVKLDGSRLSFKVAADDVVYAVKVTVDGRTLKGGYTTSGGGSGSLTGSR